MSSYVETRIISLSSESASRFRNGSYLSDVIFSFKGLLKHDPDIIHKTVTLANAQVPVSFYVVNYTNNVFVVKNNTTNITYTISLPVGNYNSTSFIAAVLQAISSASGLSINISISKTTGLLSFSATWNFTFISTSTSSTSNKIFGFDSTSNFVSVLNNLTSNYEATTPYPLNLIGIKQLQIKSSIFSTNNFSSNSNQTSLLGVVPVEVGSWGLITYASNSGANSVSFNNLKLDEFDIQIVDAETNQFINFWGCNWSMTLVIQLTRLSIPLINQLSMNEVTDSIKPVPFKKDNNKDEEELKILES